MAGNYEDTPLFREAYSAFWDAVFTDFCKVGATHHTDEVLADFEAANLLAGPADTIIRAAMHDAVVSVDELVMGGIDVKAAITGAIIDTWQAPCGDPERTPARLRKVARQIGFVGQTVDECFAQAFTEQSLDFSQERKRER